jgi:serine phosphatase RsbU (regulator of sigma subunit)
LKKTIFILVLILAGCIAYAVFDRKENKTAATPSLPDTDMDTSQIYSMAKQATEFAIVGELERAEKLNKLVYAFSQKLDYKKGLGMAMTIDGRILYRRARYDSALFILNKALTIAKELNDSSLQSVTYLNIGNAYSYRGSHTSAIEYYFKGLAVEEKLATQEYLQWYFNNIGVVFATQKNYVKGLEYFLKSKRVAEQKVNAKSVDLLYNNIGWLYMLTNKKDSSLFFLNQSLQLSEKLNNQYALALCLHNLGELYLRMQQYEKAFQFAFRSYEISKQQGFRDQIVANLETLGNVRLDQKRYDEAENYLLQGMDISKAIDAKTHIITVSSLLARLYEQQQDYKKAYGYYELFSNTNDTVLNQVNSKRIAEMNTRYMTEQKEKEIELLRKNEQIQQLELAKNKGDLSQQRNISISIFIGFILLMIVALLMYNGYLLNKKTNYKLQKAFKLIEEKNALIENSNNIIKDSIAYAKRLQDAILPKPNDLERVLSKDFFIFHKPSHIVSGDFYWCSSQQSKTIVAIADCTGHGVPGGFMSMIGNSLLNEIVNERKITEPSKIAELLDKRIIHVLHQYENSQQYDGMDISICCIDRVNKEITYTGAKHAMYTFNGKLKKIKGDPYSLGGAQHQQSKSFTSQTFPYEEGLRLYLFTDGYCDQSGGTENKRFTSRQFENLLTQIQLVEMQDQKAVLEKVFEEWKGNTKQRDDILVVGIKC